MSESIVSFEHVSKSYPQYHQITGGIKQFLFNLPKAVRLFKTARYLALHDISFEVKQGETFGIIGRNGAGKSTTLGLIAGVLKSTIGKVSVKGKISPLLELGAGFNSDLTGRENIFLNGVLMGLTRKEVANKVDDIIEFSELGEFIEQPIRVYSSGMLARLGFSVASSLDPEILLIDEILAVGDITFQHKCVERMMSFKQKKVTMVFVSHSMESMVSLCDRAMWIENHTVKMIGDAKAVVKEFVNQS
ncbi:ABC transporter ATP-binding protein [bacterium]|nr:ABC transporter ATP-binding protein [bacterium]